MTDHDNRRDSQPWYLRAARRSLEREEAPASASSRSPAGPTVPSPPDASSMPKPDTSAPSVTNADVDGVLPMRVPQQPSPKPAVDLSSAAGPATPRVVVGDDDLPPWPPRDDSPTRASRPITTTEPPVGDPPKSSSHTKVDEDYLSSLPPQDHARTPAATTPRADARRPRWLAAGFAAALIAIAGAGGYVLGASSGLDADVVDTGTPPSTVGTSIRLAAAPPTQALCDLAETREGLRIALFGRARLGSPTIASGVERLVEASTLSVAEPRLKAADARSGATLCTGRLVLQLANLERRVGTPFTASVDYMIQPAVGRRGHIYDLAGAEPLVAHIAAFAPRLAAPAEVLAPDRTVAETQSPAGRAEPSSAGRVRNLGRTELASSSDLPPPRRSGRAVQAREAVRDDRAKKRAEDSDRYRVDCDKPADRTDRFVCASTRLRSLDSSLAALSGGIAALGDAKAVKKMDRSRLRFIKRLDRCSTEACAANLYRDRIESLADLLRPERKSA